MRQHLPQALEAGVYALHAAPFVAVGNLPAHPLFVLVHHNAADAGIVVIVATVAASAAATTSPILGGDLAESVVEKKERKKRQTLPKESRLGS